MRPTTACVNEIFEEVMKVQIISVRKDGSVIEAILSPAEVAAAETHEQLLDEGLNCYEALEQAQAKHPGLNDSFWKFIGCV